MTGTRLLRAPRRPHTLRPGSALPVFLGVASAYLVGSRGFGIAQAAAPSLFFFFVATCRQPPTNHSGQSFVPVLRFQLRSRFRQILCYQSSLFFSRDDSFCSLFLAAAGNPGATLIVSTVLWGGLDPDHAVEHVPASTVRWSRPCGGGLPFNRRAEKQKGYRRGS